MNEPKWTHHRVTMPEDMALKYLDKLLALVNKQFLDPGYPIALSMAIDKMRSHLPDNKALTVEELREMVGEPVWCESTQNTLPYKGWYLVDTRPEFAAKPLVNINHAIRANEISRGLWFAYRRPPKERE